ncbi:hypothetical protein CHS0354_037880 [Potamilus streckersoni]|uniref:C2H2-type domain-containing protein n=1 Tax=Potamilus streckersoni TaxID=2493646 RepID=A0AAE0WA97_9BIVA|nr:hypothetical protein CHS0354_037880 [Potamilus streckersoni]
MSAVEHQATVDKGLKMKIKRKNGATSKTDRHEIVKTEQKTHHSDYTSQSANGILAEQTSKLSLMSDRDKLLKMKSQCRKDKGKEKVVKSGESVQNGGATSVAITTSISANSVTGVKDLGTIFGQSGNAEPKPGETPSNTKKDSVLDPYEFNAKLEDVVTMPMKKIKLEKTDSISTTPSHKHLVHHHDVATETNSIGVVTEPDCLGPCEPGTSVTLEGIVWHETENGVLVVNVTWRGKTYVGTLLDATRHDWAPPRFNCESPVSDFDVRTPKGRGKRGRAVANTPVTDRPTSEQGRKLRKGRRGSSASTFQAPPSPARSDISTSSGTKRKGRPTDIDLTCEGGRSNKRSKPNSQESTPVGECPSPTLIECPEPNCNKKYKHINGLRYHQSHAHQNTGTFEDEKDEDGEDSAPPTPNKRGPKEKEASKKEAVKKEICKDADESVENLKNKNSELNMNKKDESKIEDNKAEKDISKELKSQKKDEKSDIGAAKYKDINVATTCSSSKPVVASTKPSTTCPSIFTVATNSVANLTSVTCSTAVVAQPGSPTSSVSSTAATKPSISNALPITVTAITTLTQSLEIKSEPAKLDKNPEKLKVKPTTRPIIPAPAPQMIASVTVTHTNLAPVTSHTQVSPQLKPIQPKPTIMGEPANINPALVGLNKKKVPKKKGKDIPLGAVKVEAAKPERTPVIKANPQPNKIPEMRKDVNSLDAQRLAATQPQNIAVSGSANAIVNRGVDLSHAARSTSTSLLKVSSPLQVSTSEHCKTPITEDVQSPAYSDISDANESASPAQTESPQKQREENSNGSSNNKKDETPLSQPSTPKNENPTLIPHFGMYGYYGQAAFQVSNMSPVQMPTQQQQQQSQHQQPSQHPSAPKPPAKVVASKDGKGGLPDEKARQTSEEMVKQERKEGGEEKEGVKGKAEAMGAAGSNMTPQQMYEYQMQQKQLHEMYAVQQLPPHLHYLAYGGYYVNPAYMHYEKMIEEQRRAHQESGKGDGRRETGPRTSDDKLQDLSQTQKRTVDSMGSVIPKSSPNATMTQSGSAAEKSADGKKSIEKNLDRDYKEQSLREKQNENHQILKENIDLKAQMDKTRQESYERFRHAEELRRYQMYQQQKLIEERKRSEKGDLRPENLSSKAPGTKPIQETSSRDQNRGHGSVHHSDDLLRTPHLRKESGDSGRSKEGHTKDSMEAKHVEKIEKLAEDKTKQLLQDKQKNAENHGAEAPKHKVQSHPHSRSSKTDSPSTSSNGPLGPSSIPGSPSTSFQSYYSYIQTSPYGHMPVDPNHPIYRGAAPPGFTVNPAVIGYPSPYIHPSQVGYRLSAEEEEKSKLGQSQLVDLDISKPKSESGHGSQYYGSSMHKIHELQDKARPSSRSSSPVVQKSTTPVSSQSSSFSEKHREYSSSPPTQRHVHTHHHTHVVGITQGTFAPVYDAY